MDLQLEGNVALATAATSGLGLASAEALAAEGADVVVCGRTESRLDSARKQLAAAGPGDVRAIEADITDPDHVEALVEETVETFGGLDHLVTSAGGPPSGSFLDTPNDAWYDAYDLLVMSAVRTTRAAYPHLKESDAGSIVNITSRSVREVIDDLVLSNAVRRAVIGLMKTQAREFAPDVRVNAVLPGAHETARIEELIDDAVDRGEYDSYEEGYDDWAADVPMGRIGEPRELGDVVAFLSSPRASFLTGAAVPIDGGSMRS
ncbi:Putative oxidoreductase protein [Halorhabdus tiamatea SARL4B]|uniref:Putative oxidoreductase protein n=1 Tax=Halorhabdus tiamatea SARL4B TaxID=1033806 RepID=F7PJX7_9EURY|nr:SDR family oxidoreductase [Halorhabdus tiamatea]ERJ07506.1 Putative oxidoreductase protein [Halorhabdus tiamatea SARL4B]CCQ33544.1 short-chain dehydrogenase/reductase SDR [Halorhabdus tiamatea SARL4B]